MSNDNLTASVTRYFLKCQWLNYESREPAASGHQAVGSAIDRWKN